MCHPTGEWCPQGTSIGTPCALADSTTLERGAASEADCVCKASWYLQTTGGGGGGGASRTDGATCLKCPRAGVDCGAAGVTLERLTLLPGYWRASETSPRVRTCYLPHACAGGSNASGYCADGYTGPFCNE